MSTAALFAVVRRWGRPRVRPQVMNEMRSVRTMERDSAVERLTDTHYNMDEPGDIMLTGRSQTQKATYV